jgi:hypothetical protein
MTEGTSALFLLSGEATVDKDEAAWQDLDLDRT